MPRPSPSTPQAGMALALPWSGLVWEFAMTRAVLIVGFMVGLAGLGPAVAALVARQTIDERWKICAVQAARQEAALGLPRYILSAIGKAESGRFDEADRVNVAWPWTVTAEGEGRFFSSAAAAFYLRARSGRELDSSDKHRQGGSGMPRSSRPGMGRSEAKLAGAPGFEPGMAVPKTAALPLGYAPTVATGAIHKRSRRRRQESLNSTGIAPIFVRPRLAL